MIDVLCRRRLLVLIPLTHELTPHVTAATDLYHLLHSQVRYLLGVRSLFLLIVGLFLILLLVAEREPTFAPCSSCKLIATPVVLILRYFLCL